MSSLSDSTSGVPGAQMSQQSSAAVAPAGARTDQSSSQSLLSFLLWVLRGPSSCRRRGSALTSPDGLRTPRRGSAPGGRRRRCRSLSGPRQRVSPRRPGDLRPGLPTPRCSSGLGQSGVHEERDPYLHRPVDHPANQLSVRHTIQVGMFGRVGTPFSIERSAGTLSVTSVVTTDHADDHDHDDDDHPPTTRRRRPPHDDHDDDTIPPTTRRRRHPPTTTTTPRGSIPTLPVGARLPSDAVWLSRVRA